MEPKDIRPRYIKDIEDNISTVHNINNVEFQKMRIGYNGTLSRHGKVLIITIPFGNSQIAKNAEKAILGVD